jgi:peptide/nickel transport system permease protein
MSAFILRRLWQMIPTLIGVMLLIFVLFNFVGGDPAYLLAGKMSNPAQIASIRHQLGIDEPYYVQLGIFAQQVLTGDFGNSWASNEPVSHILATRIGPSLTVLIPILIIETVLSLLIAVLVAWVRGSLTDRAIMVSCTLAMSISLLVYILLGQYVLAYQLGWFPVQGWGETLSSNLLGYAALPILLGVAVGIAPNVRLYRSFVLDEINQDYVRTARAKGLSEARVMLRHVLRNALIPIITNLMMYLPGLLVGHFLLERFFSIPGIGREVILAVERSDFPVIKAITVYVAIATMLINLITDLLYKKLDPRVSLQ